MSETTNIESKPGKSIRIIRRGLFVLACLVTLIAILFAEEDWRGKRAWEKYKTELEAKGEKLDLLSFAPPSVPEGHNFAMTPFLAPLFDYNPRPLAPGESIYRDTNGADRANNFGHDLKYPDSTAMWAKSEPVDLAAWAVAFLGKSNAPPGGAASITRQAAAAIVLKGLEKYRPVLDEIQSASRRSYSRFNIDYDNEIPASIMLPHLSIMKGVAQIFLLRASAELALGKNDAAFEDVKMGLYLSSTIKDEPFLICGLVRVAILQLTLPHIWEGLATHQWTDAQLAEFEKELGGIDLLGEYEVQMRGERALGNGDIDYLRKSRRLDLLSSDNGNPPVSAGFGHMLPAGLFYQNQLVINRMYQELFLPAVDPAGHRVFADKVSEEDSVVAKELFSGFPPYKILARLLLPAMESAARKYAYGQVNLDLATAACALERYRLENGQFPDALDALAPKFIAKIPNDVITGEPLKYRRTDDGQFLLYSVGWNGKDDGGQTAMGSGTTPHVDNKQGDWVWPVYPVKPF